MAGRLQERIAQLEETLSELRQQRDLYHQVRPPAVVAPTVIGGPRLRGRLVCQWAPCTVRARMSVAAIGF